MNREQRVIKAAQKLGVPRKAGNRSVGIILKKWLAMSPSFTAKPEIKMRVAKQVASEIQRELPHFDQFGNADVSRKLRHAMQYFGNAINGGQVEYVDTAFYAIRDALAFYNQHGS